MMDLDTVRENGVAEMCKKREVAETLQEAGNRGEEGGGVSFKTTT